MHSLWVCVRICFVSSSNNKISFSLVSSQPTHLHPTKQKTRIKGCAFNLLLVGIGQVLVVLYALG